MSIKNSYIASAVGFCVSILPFTAFADTSAGTAPEESMFVPMVAECVETPTELTCEKVRAVITECATELEDELCDVLFTHPSKVFETPALQEEAQALLFDTSEEIAQIDFVVVQNDGIADIVEEGRADAERSMLRGDENLMSHSGPPVVED